MSMTSILVALFDHGHARVGPWQEQISTAEVDNARHMLTEREAHIRAEFVDPPAFDVECAIWAASVFYRAGQLAVYRSVDADTVQQALSIPCPFPPSPSAHYSVDLVFSGLPDLSRLARSASSEDPLLSMISRLAGEWPLSSVGMANVVVTNVATIVSHGGLLRCYADRIISRGDIGRLAEPAVREVVRASLGAHSTLAPAISAALHETTKGPAA